MNWKSFYHHYTKSFTTTKKIFKMFYKLAIRIEKFEIEKKNILFTIALDIFPQPTPLKMRCFKLCGLSTLPSSSM